MSAGRLSVCATPIGNLGDVTLRVLDALREADLIAAEDTRITRRLLARHGIGTPLEPYHAHNLERRTPALVKRITAGAHVALVSDAGTPGVSDPGAHLVDACRAAGVPVEVLPGPSAIVTALVASGLPTHAFYFGGFLPRKSGERRSRLESLADLDATLVFYESPRRAAATLETIAVVLPGREAAMARELTKVYEEVARGPVEVLAAELAGRGLKGEVVLLVGPPPRGSGRKPIDPEAVRQRLQEFEAGGMSRSTAVRQVAADLGVPRNDVYRIAHGTYGRDEGPATSA
ncbi:MAG: 16S rRNA (cytidine(1402)-2'-O)-methyltransferase [Coriobacteriia bacterium]|nr:16S rRNA (cytidine(1402)-2'-O)-methyltransferase [Coriobacteriia bacterium]